MNTTLISVKVKASAKKELVEKISNTKFKFSVREKPEGNRANHRAVELLAKHFNAHVSKVRIVKGHHSPSKLFSVSL